MMKEKRSEQPRGAKEELWRAWLVTGLLLAGLASVAAAAFLVGPALGLLVLGLICVALAVLIQLSGGGADVD